MARKPRIWFPGATYHIMCRGNHRRTIFRENEDRKVYLNFLREAKQDNECTILSYCLMTNHVHLQIETADIEIAKMMKQLNMKYAIYFNRKYDLVGHLFQGRYRSELITVDAINLEVSRYVHLNPVKAKIAKDPLEYKWSSYPNYVGHRSDSLVSPGKILRYFTNDQRDQYQRFVEWGLTPQEDEHFTANY